MLLIGILISSVLISSTISTPITYTSYGRRELTGDRPQVLLLVDNRIPDLENEMFDSGNDPGSTVIRTKRIGSLSIVNSLDVLRQRVLLELARRKALQDQRQIDANRRFLETIGKRSLSTYDAGFSKPVDPRARNGLDFAIEAPESHDRSTVSERIPGRAQDWFNGNEPEFRERQDYQVHKIPTNGLRLL